MTVYKHTYSELLGVNGHCGTCGSQDTLCEVIVLLYVLLICHTDVYSDNALLSLRHSGDSISGFWEYVTGDKEKKAQCLK
jgi:hypothetical protein